MGVYNIKMNQSDGSSFNLYRPETSAKYCYVSSEVASLFGYNKETPIEDIISLGAQDNLHWWEKTKTSQIEYLGNSVTVKLYTGSTSSDTKEMQYSDSYEINQLTGKVMLSGKITTISVSKSEFLPATSLMGKYIYYNSSSSYSSGAETVFQVQSDSIFEGGYSGSSNKKFYIYFKNVKPVLIKETSETEYLSSSNISSYPIYNSSNGIIYRYLGQPSNLFKRSAKIIHGSWVGTGNRNATITFEYQPLLVFFGGGYAPITTSYPVTDTYYYFGWQSTDGLAAAYWSPEISYSNSSPQLTVNLNTIGSVYYYTAIC